MNIDALNKATKGNTKTNGVTPFMELDISKVYPNPDQPRKEFNKELLQELAFEIKHHGLIQPIAVAKRDGQFMIISGERRWRAHKLIDALTIKAHIIEVDDHTIQELSLIENIQREDLTEFEIAVHIGKLWKSGKYTQKSELAKAIGKSQSYMSKVFSALKLDEEILKDIEDGKHDIPVSVLDEISRLNDSALQIEVYKKYLNKEIVRSDIRNYKHESEIEVQRDASATPTKKEEKLKTKEIEKDSTEQKEKSIVPKINYSYTAPNYEEVRNIEIIKETIKRAVDSGYVVDENYKLKIGPNKEKDFIFLDNSYEKAIYDLYVELRDITDKEIFVISYQQKKGSQVGGGHRVRAINKADAIEQGRAFYKEYAKDSNYFFTAQPLRGYESNPRFTSPVGYGFGTRNDIGAYVTSVDGDFKGTFTFSEGGEFIQNTNNKEYKIIIEEV